MRPQSEFARHFVSVAFGASCLVASASNARADAEEPIALQYQAPESCPDEAAFLSKIRTRVAVRKVPGDDSTKRFTVTISALGTRVVGTITSIAGQGEPSARAISGPGCAEVVDALALVAAMDLHPESESEQARDPASSSVAPGSPPFSESSPLAEPAEPVRATTPSNNETAESSGNRRDSRFGGVRSVQPEGASLRSDATYPKRLRVLGAGHAEVILGFEPGGLLGRAVELELLNAPRQVLKSTIAIALSTLGPSRRTISEGNATLTWTLGQLRACPVAFAISRSLALLPCARLDAGRLTAAGGGIVAARSENLFWFSAGPIGRVFWMPAGPFMTLRYMHLAPSALCEAIDLLNFGQPVGSALSTAV
jgi:hypothetical protein